MRQEKEAMQQQGRDEREKREMDEITKEIDPTGELRREAEAQEEAWQPEEKTPEEKAAEAARRRAGGLKAWASRMSHGYSRSTKGQRNWGRELGEIRRAKTAERDREIMGMHRKGMTQKEIAEKEGMTQQAVSHIIRRETRATTNEA